MNRNISNPLLADFTIRNIRELLRTFGDIAPSLKSADACL